MTETTTIKVFRRDAERLAEAFGGPQWRAFHMALEHARSGCEHPEGLRRYTTAVIPADGDDVLNLETGPRTIGGFYCGACRRYIFPYIVS